MTTAKTNWVEAWLEGAENLLKGRELGGKDIFIGALSMLFLPIALPLIAAAANEGIKAAKKAGWIK